MDNNYERYCISAHTEKSFTSEAQVNPFVLKFLLLAVHLLPQLKLYRVKYCQWPSKNFGLQYDDFSKIWPSSRFVMAMAGVRSVDIFIKFDESR
jgi:hypothetical protein